MKVFFKSLLRVFLITIIAIGIVRTVLTGCPIPLVHVDFLNDGVNVSSTDGNRLLLPSGGSVVVPGVRYVPTNEVVCAALKRGIEVTPEGRVFGLLNIHHWCGNDPVCYDRRRIDITSLCWAVDVECWDPPFPSDDSGGSHEHFKFRSSKISIGKFGMKVEHLYTLALANKIAHQTRLKREKEAGSR